MRTLYQITCSCGKVHEVPKTQGGGSLTCECGKTLDVPPLRELVKLPSVERPDKVIAEELSLASEGGVRQRRLGMMIFMLCLAIFFGGMSGYYYVTRPYIPKMTDCNLYETWQIWQYLRPGIDAPFSRQETLIINNINVYWRWIVLLACASVLCLLGTLAILFAPVARKKKK